MHCKVEADHSEDGFNDDALVVGKVVFVVLAHQGRGAQHRKKDKHQAGGLEPKGIKRAAYGRDKRFSAGKDRVEQAEFLYNGLHSVFYRGNLRHLGHCSAKNAALSRKNKTQVTRRASNLSSPKEFA